MIDYNNDEQDNVTYSTIFFIFFWKKIYIKQAIAYLFLSKSLGNLQKMSILACQKYRPPNPPFMPYMTIWLGFKPVGVQPRLQNVSVRKRWRIEYHNCVRLFYIYLHIIFFYVMKEKWWKRVGTGWGLGDWKRPLNANLPKK